LSFATKPNTAGDLRSHVFPGGSLLRALLDRRLMGLADMGGSSGLVGASWSDVVAGHIDALVGTEVGIPGGGTHVIEHVIRLDALPHVGLAASKRALQNPDFVLLGRSNGHATMQAADAKFSIETARSKQVSIEVLAALAEVGREYTDLLGAWHETGHIVPGLFFAPRSALTAYVLSGGRGIVRATVEPDEVVLLQASATDLTGSIPGGAARRRLAEVDQFDAHLESELLFGLYYTRLSSAAGASWFDMNRPLFGPPSEPGPDFEAVDWEIGRRAGEHRSGYALIAQWAEDAESVRADRTVIEQAAALPLPNRELREWVSVAAVAAGLEAPSLNRVRKTLQRWVQAQVLDEVGIIRPDEGNVGRHIDRIRGLVAGIAPYARAETARIVMTLGAPSELADSGGEQVERRE